MATVTVSIDVTNLKHNQAKFNEGLKAIQKAADDAARLTAKDMLEMSFPAPNNDPLARKGGTQEALNQGMKNIQTDINKMFVPLNKFTVRELVMQKNPRVFMLGNPIVWRDEGLARSWANHDMETLFNAFASIDDGMGDDDTIGRYDYDEGAMFKEQDFKSIRYVGSPNIGLQKGMMKNGRWNKKDRVAVDNTTVIRKFVQERQKSIGKSANGWNKCLGDIGQAGKSALPASGKGGATATITGLDKKWSLKNPLGDPNGWVSKLGIIGTVIQRRNTDLQVAVTKITNDLAKYWKHK